MTSMKQYEVSLTGITPLIMHADNLIFAEKLANWRKDPGNKASSVRGDDRSPAWTWLGYLSHDRKSVGISSDNLMTMLREGGSKVKTGKGTETFKKQTQAGLIIDKEQWEITNNETAIEIKEIWDLLIGNNNFQEHVDLVENAGFELLVKRAKVNSAKHVRVRPMFRNWRASGTLTVLDEETTGLTKAMLQTILDQAGALCGLCDWRPSSPKASGRFGMFTAQLEKVG